MKKMLFVLAILFTQVSFAQTLPVYDQIKLEAPADYKAADKEVLAAADYLFSSPINKNDINRLTSLRFIIKWMSGTPDYNFSLQAATTKLFNNNDDLLGLYMAGLTKYVIENPANSKDEKIVNLNAMTLLLNYVDNKNNNAKITRGLKKLSEAKEQGKLAEAL